MTKIFVLYGKQFTSPCSSKRGYKNAREYGNIYNHFKLKGIVPTVFVKKKEYISLTANWPKHTFSGYFYQIFVILASLAIIQQNTVLTSLDYKNGNKQYL